VEKFHVVYNTESPLTPKMGLIMDVISRLRVEDLNFGFEAGKLQLKSYNLIIFGRNDSQDSQLVLKIVTFHKHP
jgi:hypothetical protein